MAIVFNGRSESARGVFELPKVLEDRLAEVTKYDPIAAKRIRTAAKRKFEKAAKEIEIDIIQSTRYELSGTASQISFKRG